MMVILLIVAVVAVVFLIGEAISLFILHLLSLVPHFLVVMMRYVIVMSPRTV